MTRTRIDQIMNPDGDHILKTSEHTAGCISKVAALGQLTDREDLPEFVDQIPCYCDESRPWTATKQEGFR